MAIKNFTIKLDAKIKKDAGISTASAGDVNGTEVFFNIPFADIASINLTASEASGGASASWDF
ncbi:hypothetical protein THIOSC15_3450002 [uncultured Thiomicrorhabdus sp.]